jgi:glycosyltransferase involved in cell wall biosynthesis
MTEGTIIYIGGFELPDKNAAAHRVIANGKLLRDLGYNLCFVGISKEASYEHRKMYGFDCHAIAYPNSIYNWFKYITEFGKYRNILDSYKNVKAVICYNIPAASLFRTINYCRKREIKIYADCTEWYVAPKKGNFFARKVKAFDIKWRMNNLHLKMDGVIVISSFLNRFYEEKGLRTLQLPPLVDCDDAKFPVDIKPRTSKKLKLIYSGSPFSLTVGSDVKDRLDLIIKSLYEVAKTNPIFELTILGMDKDGFLQVFPDYGEKLSFLEDMVFFRGKVSHNLALQLLKESDFAIFLRDINLVSTAGFPTKFVEAISCGIPVLTNRNSNLQDYFVDGKNGFWINSQNEIEVTLSLLKVLNISEDELQELKRNAFNSRIFDYRSFKESFKKFLK